MLRYIQFYFYILLVGISVILIKQSLAIPIKEELLSSPRMLPLFLSIIMLILSLAILFKEIIYKQVYQVLPDNIVSFLGFILLMFLYVFLIPVTKFAIATFGFLLICFLFFKATNLWKGILISAGFVIVIMLVFEKVFHIIFP